MTELTLTDSLPHEEVATADRFARDNARWNFWVSVLDTVFIMAGISIVSRDTVMPALIAKLTDSKLVLGLIPAIFNLGMYLPQLLIANSTERMRYKLPYIAWFSATLERGPYLGMALLIWWIADLSPTTALVVFFLLLAITSTTIGLLVPAWYDMIAKVIPVERRGRYSGIGHALGALLSVVCAYYVGRIIEVMAFPNNFALLFLVASGVMFLSWVALVLTREPPSLNLKEAMPISRYLRQLPQILRTNQNYARFLLSRTLILLGLMANGFFVVYALGRFDLPDSSVGIFTAVLVGSQAVMSLVWGYVADRTGYKLVLAASAFALAIAQLFAIFAPSPFWFYAAFLMIGAYSGADYVAALNIILEFAPAEERPTYIGLTNTLYAPALTLGPLFGGWLAEMIGYRGLFVVALAMAIAGGLMMTLLVREPRKG